MKVMGSLASTSWKFAAGFVFLSWSFGSTAAQAQAPYLIPYTISTIAGGGTAPVAPPVTTPPTPWPLCAGTNPNSLLAEDVVGDGCPVSSPSVVNSSVIVSSNIHDVGVDPIGGVYFLEFDTNSTLRKIDPHSGIINVLAGTLAASTTVCTTALDKYGDNCPANDGKGNAAGLYTYLTGTMRGIAVGANGDVYIADYSNGLIHKVSASTGKMTLVAGDVAGYATGTSTSKTSSTKGGYTGDGGLATNAQLYAPRGVGVDAAGNIYIADSSNNVVRKVTASTGIITTIVGKYPSNPGVTSNSFGGDGGPANVAAVLLCVPEDVEVDANGNLFIGDFDNNRVRVVYAGGPQVAKLIALTNGGAVAQAGYIYTVVGGGVATYTPGTIVLATSIFSGANGFGGPRKLLLDARGNIYIADNTENVIWFVDGSTGYMRVLAGTFGTASGTVPCAATNVVTDNVNSTLTTLYANSDMGVGVGPQGDVYVSDSGDCRLRKVALNTTFPAVASGSSATQTLFVHFAVGDTPAASLPFTITGSPDFAVTGTCGSSPAANADNTTDCPVSVTFTPTRPGLDTSILTIKSALNQTVKFELNGTGTAASVALDPGNTALIDNSFSTPGGIAQDSAGNTYVADTGNNRVVEYLVGSTTPTLIAGTGTSSYTGDGAAATNATLKAPKAVAVTPDGAVYIADSGNNVIRRVDPVTGFISTFAGGGTVCALNVQFDTLGDGCTATQAKFSAPAGIISDSIGNLYVSDTGNNVIREISTNGYVYLIAGPGIAGCTITGTNGDGCAPTSSHILFSSPTALALDNMGNLYIADTGNNEVRKITVATNLVSRFAGTGQAGYSGDGEAANDAEVNLPTGLALDAANNLYIADTGNHAVRVVNVSNGDISTVIGTLGVSSTVTVPGTTVPGSASGVLLNLPGAVVASGIGKLTILDSGNNRLISLDRGSISVNLGRTNDGTQSPVPAAIQETSTGSSTATLGSPLFTPDATTGIFTLTAASSNGCSSSTPQTLAPGAFCNLSANFFPPVSSIVNAPYSATYTEQNATTLNTPAITLSGTGAILTPTTLTTAVTAGNLQYPNSFTVTATLQLAKCDPTKTNCSPDFTAAGTVTFFIGNTPTVVTQVGLPVTVSNTSNTSSNVITAPITINGQSVGTHYVVAVYSGDTYYASSPAAPLPVAVAQGSTTTVVTATPSTSTQFSNLTLSAQVSSATSAIPTGTIAFYAGNTLGNTLLGSSGVNTSTGVASIQDAFTTDSKGNITIVPQSFGLTAGTYKLTAVYSGDNNYATSTSAGVPLVITADPQGFAVAQCMTYNVTTGCAPAPVGTAQGSTAQALIYIIPSNTLSGTLSFACSGLPANSVCTFSATTTATQPVGSTLTFSPVAGSAVAGTTVPGAPLVGGAIANPSPALPPSFTVTLWTDANSNVNSASNAQRSRSTLAGVLGWPILLGGFTMVLGFRKRLRNSRLLAGLALFALLTGSATVLTGCTSALGATGQTPVGSYTVTITVTGPNSLVQSTPITFTVGAGIAGQS
jgi:sugar lactone lactonase YvrE